MNIDRFRPGYPKYAAFLSTHNSFQVYRRFARTRSRLLLEKQHEIVGLERQLDETDLKEPNALFLGCLAFDQNDERRRTLAELKRAMEEYDDLLQQQARWLRSPAASNYDVTNIKNWLAYNACIAEPESRYLDDFEDVFSLAGFEDSIVVKIENLLTSCIAWSYQRISRIFCELVLCKPKHLTDDNNVFVFGSFLTAVSRAGMSMLATAILVAPIIILDFMTNKVVRLVVIILASSAFVLSVTLLAKARTFEVLAAGAAYAAVVVSFTASNANNQDEFCKCRT